MKCKICLEESTPQFKSLILNKYNVQYYHCNNCNFIQTEDPYWISEAYKQAIGTSDTGIIQRNLLFIKRVAAIIFIYFGKDANFLDYGAGYGLFVRMMRDIGFNFYWQDKYCNNLFADGFEFDLSMNNIELITAFECFEHFNNPIEDINQLMRTSRNILFSTEIFEGPPPSKDWWYYSFDEGQHIAFYSLKTLSYLARKYDLNLISNGKNFHLLTEKSFSNFNFKIILKLSHLGALPIIKLKMDSKTLSDRNFLISKMS